MCMIFWAFMKVGPASRHVVTLLVKNLCPGIRARLATPLQIIYTMLYICVYINDNNIRFLGKIYLQLQLTIYAWHGKLKGSYVHVAT